MNYELTLIAMLPTVIILHTHRRTQLGKLCRALHRVPLLVQDMDRYRLVNSYKNVVWSNTEWKLYALPVDVSISFKQD